MPNVESILLTKGPDVIVLTPETTVHEAVKMMCEANVGSVVLQDAERNIVGIFTERDLLRKVVTPAREPTEVELEQVMTSPVITVELETDIRDLPRIFHEKHIRHLAVVEKGVLVGMISSRDLLEALIEPNLRMGKSES